MASGHTGALVGSETLGGILAEKKLRELWTIEELQNYLKMPRSTVYLLVAQGKIPSVKLGKHRRFIPDDVELALRKMPK